jgi:daunorubicin/doxorubicin transport system permease protein
MSQIVQATQASPSSQAAIIPGAKRKLRNRVGLGQTIRDTWIMAFRGLLKIRRTPEQLFDVIFQPIIFTLLFSQIFGGAIAGNVQSYLPILVPGLLAQTVLTTTSVTGTQLREDMDKGVFDRFKSLPIARIAPLAGALLTDTVRYLIATTLTFATGFALGYRPAGGITGVLAAGALMIVCAWALSWVFALLGVISRTASSVQGLSLLILLPLTFFSNAFVSVKTMPDWLQTLVNLNPVTHLITAVRDLAEKNAVSSDLWWALLGAAIIVVVFAPLTVRLYMRKA